eukprot:365657-Chlamydomonas_euryale.AAC.1
MLVDSTVPPQLVDVEYAAWLADNGVPFTIVFTKTDKRRKGVSKGARAKESNMTAFKRELLKVGGGRRGAGGGRLKGRR